MGRNALCQSDCKIFKSTVSLEQNDEIGDTNSWKLKFDWKLLWWAWLKNGCVYSYHRTLRVAAHQGW